jgi:hypothetical protein
MFKHVNVFDRHIFNMFIALYKFLSIPQYILKNENREYEKGLSSRNMLFSK